MFSLFYFKKLGNVYHLVYYPKSYSGPTTLKKMFPFLNSLVLWTDEHDFKVFFPNSVNAFKFHCFDVSDHLVEELNGCLCVQVWDFIDSDYDSL